MTDGITLVRRDVWSLPAGDKTLEWYAKGVAAMKQRPASDPTSWTYQAAIHGSKGGSPLPLQRACQHGSWFFISWHRMYLYFFEQIVRAAVVAAGGPADWTLPYWNYSRPAPANTIPMPFRDHTSALYVSKRRQHPYDINGGAGLHPDTVSFTAALKIVPFEPVSLPITGFAGQVVSAPIHYNQGFGQLEQQPHNVVHDAVGGLGGLMTDPDTAAQDPIFWLHHANIDRLWASWVAIGNGRANTTDARWTNQAFQFFDASAAKVTKHARDTLTTTALGYTYDRLETLPPGPEALVAEGRAPQAHAALVGSTSKPVVLTGGRAAGTVMIDRESNERAMAEALPTRPQHVILSLDDITADRNPATPYYVYVNLPENASQEEARDHLAGTLSFFGIEQASRPGTDAHPHAFNVAFDITDLATRLRSQGMWDPDKVDVGFRPADFVAPEGVADIGPEALIKHEPVHVGRISVHYT